MLIQTKVTFTRQMILTLYMINYLILMVMKTSDYAFITSGIHNNNRDHAFVLSNEHINIDTTTGGKTITVKWGKSHKYNTKIWFIIVNIRWYGRLS